MILFWKLNIIGVSSDPLRTMFGPCSDHVRLASVICRDGGGSFSTYITEERTKMVRRRYEENCQRIVRIIGNWERWEETAALFGGGCDTENHGGRHGEPQRKK